MHALPVTVFSDALAHLPPIVASQVTRKVQVLLEGEIVKSTPVRSPNTDLLCFGPALPADLGEEVDCYHPKDPRQTSRQLMRYIQASQKSLEAWHEPNTTATFGHQL